MPTAPAINPDQRWNQFRQGFKRNARGNLVGEWSGYVVTVFAYRGRWSWCMNGNVSPTYSSQKFSNADDAMFDLFINLGAV